MISITWVTRNDNHGEYLLQRIQAAADALEYYYQRGMELELIIVEWNPPMHMPLVSEVIDFGELPTRVYIVPPKLHQQFDNSDVIDLFPHIGANVGMRRATGDWFLTTTHDCIFSKPLAVLMQSSLSSKKFYRAPRYNSKANYDLDNTEDRLVYLKKHVINAPVWQEGTFTKACGDFIMCHRSVWNMLRGYTEWPMNGIWLDSIFLFRMQAAGVKQLVLPQPIYHMDHSRRGLSIYQDQPHMPYKTYKRIAAKMLALQNPYHEINSPNWGMYNVRTVETQKGTILDGPYQHVVYRWEDLDR